jgi:DNA-binding transcriptional ArsR family regulator
MEPETRVITDSKVLSAMSHPVRRRLLDALTVDGASTVSMLAERTGQAVGNISHHIKVLAAAELVEEAPELARDRREHWWREADARRRWSTTSFDDDPAAAVVADAALSLGLEHHVEKVRAWNAARENDSGGWTDAAFSTDTWLRLTPGELAQLSDELTALLRRWHDRTTPDDGAERDPVFVFAHGVPAAP